jgi:hypothetical protein
MKVVSPTLPSRLMLDAPVVFCTDSVSMALILNVLALLEMMVLTVSLVLAPPVITLTLVSLSSVKNKDVSPLNPLASILVNAVVTAAATAVFVNVDNVLPPVIVSVVRFASIKPAALVVIAAAALSATVMLITSTALIDAKF